jgi:hypothetical protein
MSSAEERPLKLSIRWNNGKGFVNLDELRVGYFHRGDDGDLTGNAQEKIYMRTNSGDSRYFTDSKVGLETMFEIPNDLSSIGIYYFYLRYKSGIVCPQEGQCEPVPILLDSDGNEVFIQVEVNEDDISSDVSSINVVSLTSTFTQNVVQGLAGEQYSYILTHEVTGDNVIDSLFQSGSGYTVVFLSTDGTPQGNVGGGFKIKIKNPEEPTEQYYLSAPNEVLDVTTNYGEATVFWKLNIQPTASDEASLTYIATEKNLNYTNTVESSQISTKALHYDSEGGLVLRTINTYQVELLAEVKKITPVLQDS